MTAPSRLLRLAQKLLCRLRGVPFSVFDELASQADELSRLGIKVRLGRLRLNNGMVELSATKTGFLCVKPNDEIDVDSAGVAIANHFLGLPGIGDAVALLVRGGDIPRLKDDFLGRVTSIDYAEGIAGYYVQMHITGVTVGPLFLDDLGRDWMVY